MPDSRWPGAQCSCVCSEEVVRSTARTACFQVDLQFFVFVLFLFFWPFFLFFSFWAKWTESSPACVCGVGVVIIFTVSYIGLIFRGGGLSFWSVVIFFYVFLFVVISEKKLTVWIWLRLLSVTLLAVFSFLGVCLSMCHFTGEKKLRSGHKRFVFLNKLRYMNLDYLCSDRVKHLHFYNKLG